MKRDGIACIILARAGSRRLPGKNIQPLGGKPLYVHAVEAAVGADAFDTIIFSTDEPRILDNLAAWPQVHAVPRPAALAGGEVVGWDVCRHLLETLPEFFEPARAFCLLTPCHPFRNALHVREAVARFRMHKPQALLSVSEYPCPPELALDMEDGRVRRVWSGPARKDRFAKKWHPNGALAIVGLEAFRRHGHVYTEDTLGYELPWPWSLDIDLPADLALAETLAPCLLGPRPGDCP